MSTLIFGGTRDWHLGNHLAGAAKRAGLELAAMDAAIVQPAGRDADIEANQQALAAAGHWGVPTILGGVLPAQPFSAATLCRKASRHGHLRHGAPDMPRNPSSPHVDRLGTLTRAMRQRTEKTRYTTAASSEWVLEPVVK